MRNGALAAIGRRVAEYGDVVLARSKRPSPDDRLTGIRAKMRKSSARQLRARLLLSAVSIAACAAVALMAMSRRATLTYRVGGADEAFGNWFAAEASPVSLDFSDGSRVELAPGARARVAELSSRGAAVLVERGSVHVSVVPRRDNRWVIAGGPFAVHVVGTEFDVAWNPQSEALVVSMQAGHVQVSGPCLVRPKELSAPEVAEVSCRTPAPPVSASAAPDPAARAETSPSARALDPDDLPNVAPPARPEERWRVHLAAGKLEAAFVAAEVEGIAAVSERAWPAELVDLGSAARLAHKPNDASRLYEAARRRFPGTDAAAVSAYHLGRMAFDGRGAWAEADRWFGAYLSERPRGALAPEALGRSLECAVKLGDRRRARELAARYLASYPDGAHSALAKSLSGGPD